METHQSKEMTPPVLGKSQVLVASGPVHAAMKGNHTTIELGQLKNRYKLSKAYKNVRNLEIQTDQETDRQNFNEYLRLRSEVPFRRLKISVKPRPRYSLDEAYRNTKLRHLYHKGDLLVLVDALVYSQLKKSINQYVLDVGRGGYWATIHVVQGGKPADIRSYIRRRKPAGVFLVGSVAVPWFELDDDFHGAHTEFPCDLYYMDTNGTWHDTDGNGKFNDHTGNLDPEIWVGRLYTPTANGNDPALINDYFARNHAFRLGMLGHNHSALAYVDDDWTGFDDCAFDELFTASDITKYTLPTQTDADLYKSEVNSQRSWVQLCAHSWTTGHALKVGSTNEHIHSAYFRDTNPPNANFYNLFCCGPGKFTTSDYIAGWYIFDMAGGGKNQGLAAIASAKSGSMLLFEDFYRPMGAGHTIGEAFVQWWQARGPIHELWEKRWFYGLVLLGDPTLSWWKGAVPVPQQPQNGDVFDHYPRKIQFRWDPVNIKGAKYRLEVDAFGAKVAGKWAEEVNQTFAVYNNIATNTFDHSFVGAQRGRWRVCAIINGRICSWSPWSYFRFTI
jgi:hypothetical protein